VDDAIDSIHAFWFGELDDAGLCAADRNALWFRTSDATDAALRERFGALLERARAGELDHWQESDRGLVALVVLLDQFSRNIHRGTADAFSGDARALALACATVDSGRHLRLPAIHRVFLYMPLEHSEELSHQRRCVALFEALADECPREEVANFCRYAIAHLDVIERFGRFPHRNTLLGRSSSEEELDYLEKHGGF